MFDNLFPKGTHISKKMATKHKESVMNKRINDLKNHIKDYKHEDAVEVAHWSSGNLFNDINDMLSSKTLNIYKGLKEDGTEIFKDDGRVNNTILSKVQAKGFFNDLKTLDDLAKTQTGTQLMNKVTRLDKEVNFNYTTKKDMYDIQKLSDSVSQFNNIKSNGGYIIDFDIESLGGTNAYGHQQIDLVTEISAKAFKINGDGTRNIAEEMTSVLGLSEGEYIKYKNYIESLKGKAPGQLSNKDNVFLKRFSMFADKGIELEYTDGFDVRIGDTTKALSEKDLDISISNALEGLKRYRQVGEQQEAKLKTMGVKTDLAEYKKQYVKNAQEFIYNGKGLKGNYSGALVTGHNIKEFDSQMMSSYTGHQITKPNNQVLDTYQYVKYAEEILGDGAHLKGLDPKNLSSITKEFGPGTQDFLREAFQVGDGLAHNAAIDVDNHLRLLLESSFGSSMVENMTEAMNKIKPLTGQGTNGVFYLGSTGQQQWNSRNNSFNFVYDPLDNSFKSFGGTRVGSDGKITRDSFNAYGPKANALYTHEAYQIDFSGDWKQSFKDMGMSDEELDILYQKAGSADSLYVLKSKEFQDKARLEAKFGKDNPFEYGEGKTYFQFFNDQDKLATAMGARIGDVKDGSLIANEKAIDALGFKIMDVADNGSVKGVRALSADEALDQIVERSIFRQTTDSGARTVREASYSRLQAQRKFRELNDNLTVSQMIADRVSQGKALTDDITSPLIQELGWNDFKDGRKITPERLTKPMVLDKYIDDMNPFFEAMEEIFSEQGMADVFDVKETKSGYRIAEKVKGQYDNYSKKDFIFKKTLNNFMEHSTNNPLAINNAKPTIMTAAEANKLDFNTFDLFPELRGKKTMGEMGNLSKDISSINLNDKNALIKLFSKGKFDNVDVIPNGSAAYNILANAYDTIGSMEGFNGVWGDITRADLEASRGGNLAVIQSQMMNKLKTYTTNKRHADSSFGYKYARTVQDPTDVFELMQGMSKDQIKKTIKENGLFADVNDFMSAKNALNDNSAINNIVDNYFMTFKDDLLKQISGMTKQQQKVLTNQYKLARQESGKRVEELLKAIQGTDIDLVMAGSGKDAKLALMQGGDIRELNLHKYTLTDGIIEFNLGGNYYASNYAYNTSNLVRNGKVKSTDLSKIRITNAVENALDHTTSLEYITKNAKEGGRSVIDDLAYYVNSYRGKALREATPRREAINYSNMMQRAMFVDYNGLVPIFPELKQQGIFENIAKTQGESGLEFLEQFNGIVDDIAKRKYRPGGISELFANEKNIYFQIFDAGIAEEVNKFVNFGDADIESMFKLISNYTKNTAYTEGYKTLDDNPMPHALAKFDKGTRPPVYQFGNTVLYDKETIKEGMESLPKQIKDSIRIGHAASTSVGEKYLYNTASGETSGLTMKFLQIDSNSLRNKLLGDKAFKDGAAGYGEYGSKALIERAKSLSTYEQQTLMNSRVHDLAFHQTNKQVIAAKKELLATHQSTIEMIEGLGYNPKKLYPTIKDGKVTYSDGIAVKFGDALGVFGEDEATVLAKWDGLYRARYYKDGRIVSEKEMTDAINGLTGTEAIDKLNKTFDQRLEVVRKFQTYGQKVFNDTSEKSTVETLAMGVGTVDETMAKYMKAIGEEDVIGKVLTKDYEDFLISKVANEFSEDEASAFAKAFYKEKHSFSDLLMRVNGFEDVSQIGALDSLKHKSLSMPITHGLEKLRGEDGTFKGKESVLDKMFGKDNWSLLNDGSAINFENINKINMNALAEYADLDKNDFVLDKDGNKIGHKMFSHVTQVRDDSAGTFAGLDPSDGKGLKFSKLMNSNLKASAYDNDTLSLARSRYEALGLSDEYMKAFGHALNADGTIKDEFLGKSILAPVTDRMEELLVKTPGQKTLDKFVGDSRYDYLTKEFKDHLTDITVDRAELAYSYKQGTRAIDFNLNDYNYKRFNELTKELPEHLRFNMVDLTKARPGVADDWLSLDIGGQGDTITGAVNNPYANNLMIKYGEGATDYLAIARMPEKHFEDSIIKKEHISKLNALQNKIQEINSGNYGSKEELAKKREQVETLVEQIKNLQKRDLTSKTGLANEALEVRMKQSFFGKASGIVMNDNLETISDVTNLSVAERAKRYVQLQDINSGIFDKAMFGDKSLLEHYSEGKVLDSVFLSEDAFKKMGYFDDDFMKKVFGNMQEGFDGGRFDKYLGKDANLKEGMIDLLERHGDSFVAVRYPEIMEGSDKAVMGYLNRNIKDNQMLVTGHTGMSMKMDHDGDMGAVARLSTSNDESMLNYITSGGIGSKELVDQATGIQAAMMKRAVNENYYWDDKVREKVFKEGKIAKLSDLGDNQTMLDLIGNERVIDGKIISSMIDTSNMSIGELEGLKSKYTDYINMVNKDDGHAKAVEAVKQAGLSVDEYAGAYSYSLYKDEIIAKSANQSIGEINVTNQKINNSLAALMDRTQDDSSYQRFISKDIFHISEEAAISAKSSTEGLDPNRAKVWNQNIVEYLTGDISDSRAAEIRGTLKDWSQQYTIKDMDPMQYWNASETFQKRAAEVLGETSLDGDTFKELMKNKENVAKVNNMVIDDFIEGIDSLRRTGNAGIVMEQLSIGQSTAGVKRGIDQLVSFEDYTTNMDGLNRMINMMESAARDTENIHIINKMKPKDYFTNTAGEIISASERNSSQDGIGRAILEGASDVFQGIKKSNLALGALGLAAGVLVAGYVGGRPRPADVQAMEEAQDYPAPMDGHSLIDPSLAFSNMGTKQGYVVNINARTDKGRDHAVSAIQQALSSGTSSNINVSMNINDNYGNITDKDLERALADVMR